MWLRRRMRQLKRGDRIRLKTLTIMGWKGVGVVVEDQVDDDVVFVKEGRALDDFPCLAGRNEVALLGALTLAARPSR